MRYLQVSAITFTDSTSILGGRSTFGWPAAPSSAAGAFGCCTGPVTSTFLLTLVAHSDWDDPASTYIVADPPSALFSTWTVPPSVVLASITQPVSVSLAACCFSGCAGAGSCANTFTVAASAHAVN